MQAEKGQGKIFRCYISERLITCLQCDEAKPSCANCLKHSTTCTYVPKRPAASTRNADHRVTSTSLNINSSLDFETFTEDLLESTTRRRLELYLLQNYYRNIQEPWRSMDEQWVKNWRGDFNPNISCWLHCTKLEQMRFLALQCNMIIC
jgi:hypothetical protein